MAKNYRGEGRRLVLTAPYAVASGAGALIGSFFGVAINDVANGAKGVFDTLGEWDLAKTAGQTFTEGAKVYWDNAAKSCTSVSAGNSLIGAATIAALSGDAVVTVNLNGTV